MVYFQAQNPKMGKFGRALEWKKLVYFMAIGIYYGQLVYYFDSLVIYVVAIRYIFPVLVFCLK
jgi:hypothetical protein